MTEWQTILVSTLATGGLTAVGALISLVWRLSTKVGAVETRQTAMEGAMTSFGHTLTEIANVQKSMLEQITETNRVSTQRIHEVEMQLERSMSDMRTACATNRSGMVTNNSFADYQKEQARQLERTQETLDVIRSEFQRRLNVRPPVSSLKP